MKKLKCYVCNQNPLEGCMMEQYIVEKTIEFCSNYISNILLVRNENISYIWTKNFLVYQ